MSLGLPAFSLSSIRVGIPGGEELVTRTHQVRLLGPQPARIAPIDRLDGLQDLEQAGDVVGAPPMNDVEVYRPERSAPKDPRRHADDDEIDAVGGEESKDLNQVRGCHCGPGSRRGRS